MSQEITTVNEVEKTWPIVFDGKTWNLPRPTIEDVELPYLRHVREIELKGIKDNFRAGTVDYKTAMEIFQTGFSTRFFWNAAHFRETFDNPKNVKVFFKFWARLVEPSVTDDMVDGWWKAKSIEAAEANKAQIAAGEEPSHGNEMLMTLWEMLNDPNHSTPS